MTISTIDVRDSFQNLMDIRKHNFVGTLLCKSVKSWKRIAIFITSN